MVYLDQKQPSPAGFAFYTSHMQYAEGKEAAHHVCHGGCGPEEAQSEGKLVVFVEVGEV